MLLGAGGNAYDLLDTVEAINRVEHAWTIIGVLDDRREPGSDYLGFPVRGPLANARMFTDCFFASTIWNEKVYSLLNAVLARIGLDVSQFATLVHPAASVSSRAKLGRGVIVHHGVSVAGNVVVCDQVSIGPGCILGHDTMIASYTAVAAGAVIGGGVQVGLNCYIGSGSTIRQQLRIGDGTLVGMGAVVVKDVPPGSTVVGNPAAPIARSPRGRS